MARLLMRQEVLDFFGDDWVFDGVSIGWSPNQICPPDSPMTNIVAMEPRRDGLPNNIKIRVAQTGKLDILLLVQYLRAGNFDINPSGHPQLEIFHKWIGALFRKDPESRLTSKPNGSAYFDNHPATTFVLYKSTGGILEARRGVYQSFQMRFGRLTMNIDTSTTAFWVGGKNLVDSAAAFHDCRPDQLQSSFNKENVSKLIGSFFNVRHLKERGNARKIRIKDISQKNAEEDGFDETMDDGTKVWTTVKDYFYKKYGKTLRYPKLPVLITSKGNFPMEVCFSSENERYKDLLQGAETAEFIRHATCSAFERRKQIDHCLRLLSHHNVPTIASHGIAMDPNMMAVRARILPVPDLLYGNRRNVKPDNGMWNLRGLQFLKPATIRSWSLIYLTNSPRPDHETKQFCSNIVQSFRNVGMTVPQQGPPYLIGNPNGHMPSIVNDAKALAMKAFGAEPNVIFFILKGASTERYQVIKMGMDCRLGIASQVMLEEKCMNVKGGPQYLGNIALKVNVKLGGTNCIAQEELFSQGRAMLMGGDISHAPPSALRKSTPPPSCAALVGTWDKECTAYTAVTSMQEATLGMIANIEPMFMQLLKRYVDKNNNCKF